MVPGCPKSQVSPGVPKVSVPWGAQSPGNPQKPKNSGVPKAQFSVLGAKVRVPIKSVQSPKQSSGPLGHHPSAQSSGGPGVPKHPNQSQLVPLGPKVQGPTSVPSSGGPQNAASASKSSGADPLGA
ncbi:proline-rich proteoglycan 2-like [Homarus americanus]|uniref:proline-rich proteoglycan 2-like n=1 Tax=Homarus americanus TaxID=6706 RepID=UPI001C44F84E|nr:proline-rich proteoglycan 2-like [Homarus americanus]